VGRRLREPFGESCPLPEGCVAFTVSITARRAVCDFNTRQSDLVLVTGLAASGR
jgi:hypothetical protein